MESREEWLESRKIDDEGYVKIKEKPSHLDYNRI